MRQRSSGEPTGAAFHAERFRFVLVEPRTAGNVGAAARALKNLGFSRLVLVRPACDPLGRDAASMALDARDLLDAAVVLDRLDDALHGASIIVGTTGRMGRHRQPHWRLDRLAPEIACGGESPEVAVVFGREDRGLRDVELDACTHLVHLPAVPPYTSFNLAQAVVVVAYELRRTAEAAHDRGPALPEPAPHEDREAMYDHLERALASIGFTSRDTGEPIMRRFRRLIGKARATPLEVQMLRGLARQIQWAAREAGLPDDDGRETGGGR
jgi:TrmH family RNA methyltransferase